MGELEYLVSLKNRLVPFLSSNELKEVLSDIESSSQPDNSITAIYGEPRKLAREIKKGRKLKISFLAEVVLVMVGIVLTRLYLNHMSAWLYSLIEGIEFTLLFVVLTRDYLIPVRKNPESNDRKKFWVLEVFVVAMEVSVATFFYLLPKQIGFIADTSSLGEIIKWLCWVVIGASVAVFLISLLLYGIKKKIWLGGLVVQSFVCAEVTREYLSRTRNIEDLDVLAKGEYIGSCGIAFFVLSTLAILYYIFMTKDTRKNKKEKALEFSEG